MGWLKFREVKSHCLGHKLLEIKQKPPDFRPVCKLVTRILLYGLLSE